MALQGCSGLWQGRQAYPGRGDALRRQFLERDLTGSLNEAAFSAAGETGALEPQA